MFLFYSVWGFFFLIFSKIHIFLENFFFIKNNPFLIRKRTFKYISYFEKILLVLFYKKGWFEKSIANLYRKNDIIDHRKNFYPLIYSFHINYEKISYKIDNLSFFSTQFLYYTKNNFYNNKLKTVLNLCFSANKNIFINFLVLQSIYIEKYFNLNSYFFFKNKNNLNLLKLNKAFSIFLNSSSKKLILFNLDRWQDWYNFNFDKNIINFCNLKITLNNQQKKKIKNFKNNKLFIWINIVFKYKKRLNNFYKLLNKKFNGIIFFRINYFSFFNVKVNEKFKELLKYYIIKFSESSINKHINSKFLKNYNIQYLRKNRIFNKGRYSRNRQLYRTGVYWCLWLNIIMVYGLYFIFYRFSFNFGYFWWGLMFLAYSTIFSRILKYNFFNLKYLFNEFNYLINWYGFLLNNLIKLFEQKLLKHFLNINILNFFINYKKIYFFKLHEFYYFYFLRYFNNFIKNKKKIKLLFIWQGMKEKDKSFLRYKTFIHWIKEFYRLITV